MPINNFADKQIVCKVTTGGPLGTMQVAWSMITGSPSALSASGASWDIGPDGYNTVTFPAGTYVLNDVYEWRPGDTNATRVAGTGAPVPTCKCKGPLPALGLPAGAF